MTEKSNAEILMSEEIIDEKTGIVYRLEGDYYFPDRLLNKEQNHPLGKYGRMRKRYLENHNKALFDELVRAGQLTEHLMDIDETAEARVERIMQGLLKREPAPDKATDQMGWVRHMNALEASAEESVLQELIYD